MLFRGLSEWPPITLDWWSDLAEVLLPVVLVYDQIAFMDEPIHQLCQVACDPAHKRIGGGRRVLGSREQRTHMYIEDRSIEDRSETKNKDE